VVDAALEKLVANPPPPVTVLGDSRRPQEPAPEPMMARER